MVGLSNSMGIPIQFRQVGIRIIGEMEIGCSLMAKL